MGPGCFYPGNQRVHRTGRCHGLASMGPGCFYPGNRRERGQYHCVCDASMGPGCFYPGNVLSGRRPVSINPASMGPGCFYPGNGSTYVGTKTIVVLQWGRDVSIPEIRSRRRGKRRARSFNGAGMFLSRKSSLTRRRARLATCFNGAGMFLSRKCRLAVMTSFPCDALQWGRDVSIPEIPFRKAGYPG